LYKCWSKLDSKFDERVKSYPDALNGIRVLYLNPVENLFSFICICILLFTVILSNFRKTRSVSYILKNIRNLEKKKPRIKLSNLFQIQIKNKNFGIKADFFKQILQSSIFLFLFLVRSRRIEPQ